MKGKILTLTFTVFFISQIFSQTALEVFQNAFPQAFGELKITEDTKYDPSKKNEYRKFYFELSDALDELKAYEIGALQPDYTKYFNYKDLRSLDKNNKLDSVRLLIKQTQNSISQLMKRERFGADSIRAINNYMGFRNAFKSKNYDKAYEHWTILFHEYPKATKTIYIAGATVIKQKIKQANDSLERMKWIDTLLLIHDRRAKCYPKDKIKALATKSVDYYNYLVKPYDKNDSLIRLRIEENYKIAKNAIDLGQKNTPFYIYPVAMTLSFYMYVIKKITPEQFVENYLLFSDNLNYLYNKEKDSKKKTRLASYRKMIDQVFTKSDLATCENYEKIFGRNYESLKTDKDFLKKILTLMSKQGCTQTEFFEKVAIDLYNIEPSAESAYSLAILLAAKNKYEEAAKFIDEAIKYVKVDSIKANYYFDAAKIANKRGLYSQARSYAYNALELKPNWGDPYILIATMYAKNAENCGEDDFHRRAVYWAAVDKLIQAKNVDPSVASKVNELINQYSARYPKKEDGFFHSVYEGNTYTIDYCWINETTKARYIK